MRKLLFLSLALMLSAQATEESAQPLRIGLSAAAQKKAALEANVELFKGVVAKDESAKTAWENLKPEDRKAAMASVAWSKADPALRERAIRNLAQVSPSVDADGLSLKALASVAVAEGDGALRSLGRKALIAIDDKRAPELLCRALNAEDPLVKNNAIEAMREIGGPRVFEVIVEHWKEIWGASARDHVFFGQQRSYIADYDISGASYDPVVKSFFTGVVLDAKVLKVEADIYYVWIREVTNERKLPNDPAAWNRWIKKNEAQLAKQQEKNKADAIAALKE